MTTGRINQVTTLEGASAAGKKFPGASVPNLAATTMRQPRQELLERSPGARSTPRPDHGKNAADPKVGAGNTSAVPVCLARGFLPRWSAAELAFLIAPKRRQHRGIHGSGGAYYAAVTSKKRFDGYRLKPCPENRCWELLARGHQSTLTHRCRPRRNAAAGLTPPVDSQGDLVAARGERSGRRAPWRRCPASC